MQSAQAVSAECGARSSLMRPCATQAGLVSVAMLAATTSDVGIGVAAPAVPEQGEYGEAAAAAPAMQSMASEPGIARSNAVVEGSREIAAASAGAGTSWNSQRPLCLLRGIVDAPAPSQLVPQRAAAPLLSEDPAVPQVAGLEQLPHHR
jgi:hypothetical protein